MASDFATIVGFISMVVQLNLQIVAVCATF